MSKWANATAKERKSAPAGTFCGPGNTFPVADCSDAKKAVSRLNTTKSAVGPIKSCIKRKMKKMNCAIPKAWMSTQGDAGMLRHDFALPDGWTYNQLRAFLQNELSQDKPALPTDGDATDDQDEISGVNYYYPYLQDFDDTMVVFDDGDFDGDLFQCTYTITSGSAGKDVTWGDVIEVGSKTIYLPIAEMSDDAHSDADVPCETCGTAFVAFSAGNETARSDGYVIRTGTVFEAGDYPDKDVSFDPEDLYLATLGFKPLAARVNHASGTDRTPSYFDGKMGELRALSLSEDGGSLVGEVAIPEWFDTFLRAEYPDDPLKISLEFDPEAKMPTGLALIPNPRVESVALMSAYTAFAGEKPVVVREVDVKESGMSSTTTPQAAAVQAAATPEEQPVSRAEFAAMKQELDAERRRSREKDADAFAREAIRQGKYTPAMFSWLKAHHLSLAEDDAAAPKTITFARGTETMQGTRVAAFAAMIETMPAGLHLKEELPPGSGMILPFAEEPDVQKELNDQAAASARKYAESVNKKSAK